jgi:5-methylcytosine-specific restriction endonuclease McrA
MIDEPYEPNSKELDHMIPLNAGGTHTIGNVRIICRSCNRQRPHDGSDYIGPVTLWACVRS